jgi:hypothetical protein
LRAAGAFLLLASLLAVAAAGLPGMRALAAERTSDLQVASWAAARVPSGAHTVAFEITLTLAYATRLQPRDLSELTSRQLLRLDSEQQPLYLLVRVSSMKRQWVARPPGANYRLLRDSVGLISLGRLHGYTLFRVRAP